MKNGFAMVCVGAALAWLAAGAQQPEVSGAAGDDPDLISAYVIPIQDQIGKPTLYILRRGLKEAIAQEADVVVLDMDTPGGDLAVTLEILEMLGRFEGTTITYVNSEAISAGAFIAAATDEIYFAPQGVIGAAAPVMATGQDIDDTMRQKIVSYLKARVRSISEGKAYRAEVISAMIDPDYRLEVEGEVIKEKGELLSLTASEAAAEYGDPPQPLLAAGIAEDIQGILRQEFGDERFRIIEFEVTWSERLAQYLTRVSPILLGLGMLALFIEFKTPGFGIFGVSGLIMLSVVFFGHYVAGLSGNEPFLAFLLGLALIGAEVFLLPGTVIFGLTGLVLVLGSLIWAMADLWPNEPIEFTADIFMVPLVNLVTGLAMAALLAAVLARFLPKSIFWNRLILQGSVGGEARTNEGEVILDPESVPVQARGVAVTALFPSGEVEIGGRRYAARLAVGYAEPGTEVVVLGRAEFGLLVDKAP